MGDTIGEIKAGIEQAEVGVNMAKVPVAMFLPAFGPWLQLLGVLLPAVDNALGTIQKAQGTGSWPAALAELLMHLTPGQPNSPALAAESNAVDKSGI